MNSGRFHFFLQELCGALITLNEDGRPEPCDPIKFPEGEEEVVEGNDKI